MKQKLLKTFLVAFALVTGSMGVKAQGVWSTIYSDDFNDPSTFNKYWTSGNTSRYTINQTARTGGLEGDYVVEVVPLNSNNGAKATYTGLTPSNSALESYQTAEQFRISFEFNFCYNTSQMPHFKLYDASGIEVVGFYSTSLSSTSGSVRLSANGSNAGGTEIGTFDLFAAGKTPTTYNTVVIYTENNGTYMDVTWAGSESPTKYTIDEGKIVHIGEMVHNTQRYWNHLVFDNIKVELYSETEIVAQPQAAITKINGSSREVTLTVANEEHSIYYYIGDDDSSPIKYENPINISSSSTVHYYAQSKSGTKSEIGSIDINCQEITLNAPSWMRTGPASYTLTANQSEVDGLTAIPTIHYTIGGGDEKTVANGGTINDITGDIVAWAEAEGYTPSSQTSIPYVKAFETAGIWNYNLNSYPSTYAITSIANAIDEETTSDINGVTMYNLKNIDYPNLFVENSSGWLLRNQSSSAFKAQSGKAWIAFANVTTDNVIHINARRDNGGSAISNVTSGTIAYSYNNVDYYITPSENGAVSVQFNTGVSVNDCEVTTTKLYATVSNVGFATYSPSSNVAVPENVKVYTVTVNAEQTAVTLNPVAAGSVVAAGTGYVIEATEGTYPFAVSNEAVSVIGDNALKVSDGSVTVAAGDNIYVLAQRSNGNVGFSKVAANVTIPAGKAYLQLSSGGEAKASFLSFGGVTAIESVEANGKAGNNEYYTLQGVRTTAPVKGLYIVNGKKVVVK